MKTIVGSYKTGFYYFTEGKRGMEIREKWGICLDGNAYHAGLFRAVIQYTVDNNGRIVILLPETSYQIDEKEIKELLVSPRYVYGEKVFPNNHPDWTGIVVRIDWHYKFKCYYYTIQVGGKRKSKRYFDADLGKMETENAKGRIILC